MPRVAFTSSLERHVLCPAERVEGTTVRAALEGYFARHPAVRPYVLDEQDAVRHHIVVFVDGAQIRSLDDELGEGMDHEIWVMQALSGVT